MDNNPSILPSKSELRALFRAEPGGVRALAAKLNLWPQAIYQWDRVPAERLQSIEQVTEGRITRHQLRPDLFGSAPMTRET